MVHLFREYRIKLLPELRDLALRKWCHRRRVSRLGFDQRLLQDIQRLLR